MSAEDHKSKEHVVPYRLDSAVRLVGSGVAARLVGTAVGFVGGFGVTSLAVRLLGLESYGILAFGVSMLSIVAAVANSGLGLATVQQTAASVDEGSSEARTAIAQGALTAGALVGGAGGSVLVLLLFLQPVPFAGPLRIMFVVGLGLLLFGRSVSTVALSVLRGSGRMWLTEIPHALLLIGQLVVMLAAFLAGQSELGLISAGYGLVGIIGAVASVALVRRVIPEGQSLAWSISAARLMIAVAWPLAIVAVAMQVLARFDVVILGLLRTSEEVGVYEPTLKLVDRLMLMAPLLLMAAYIPASTRLHKAGDAGAFGHLYRTATKVGYVIGFPGLVLLVSFPEVALHFLYGSDFPTHRHLVWILLIGYGVNLALGVNTSALISIGQNRTTAIIYASVLGTVVVSAVALIPLFGLTGAAVSTALGYLTLNVVVSLVLFRLKRVHVFGSDVVLTFVTSLVALAAGLAASILWHITSIFIVAAVTTVISGLWVASLFAVGALNRQEVRALITRDPSESAGYG